MEGHRRSKDKVMKKKELPTHVLAGIEAGMKDILAGRTITLEEFIAKRSKARERD